MKCPATIISIFLFTIRRRGWWPEWASFGASFSPQLVNTLSSMLLCLTARRVVAFCLSDGSHNLP